MGTTPNVGLMALKAEEYGSHDKTFEIPRPARSASSIGGTTLLEHEVEEGDIWRACQTKDEADHATGCASPSSAPGRPARPPSSGWTRPAATTPRSSRRCRRSWPSYDTTGLTLEFLPVAEATRYTLERAKTRRGHHRRHRQRAA